MARDQPYEIKPKGKKFKAGGAVSGTVTPTEDLSKAREVVISLAFREGTENLIHFEPYDSVTAGGGVERGEEIPFELELPVSAVPSYRSAQPLQMGWTVRVQADVKRGADVNGFEFIDVTPAPDASEPHPYKPDGKGSLFKDQARPMPAPGAATWEDKNRGLAKKLSKDSRWDVGLSVDESVLKRGDKLVADVVIDEPSGDREEMEVGIRCCEFRGAVSDATGDDASPMPRVYGSPDSEANPAEGWVPLYSDRPEQSVEFMIPKEGPFSFGGELALLQWELVVRERTKKPGRLYTGPERVLPLWVFP